MNTVIWIVQILLALAFFMAGIMKVTQPFDQAGRADGMDQIDQSAPPRPRDRLAGSLGAIGLILPAVTGILPILTPLAAVGLVLTMIGALALHLVRRDALAQSRSLRSSCWCWQPFVIYGRVGRRAAGVELTPPPASRFPSPNSGRGEYQDLPISVRVMSASNLVRYAFGKRSPTAGENRAALPRHPTAINPDGYHVLVWHVNLDTARRGRPATPSACRVPDSAPLCAAAPAFGRWAI